MKSKLIKVTLIRSRVHGSYTVTSIVGAEHVSVPTGIGLTTQAVRVNTALTEKEADKLAQMQTVEATFKSA